MSSLSKATKSGTICQGSIGASVLSKWCLLFAAVPGPIFGGGWSITSIDPTPVGLVSGPCLFPAAALWLPRFEELLFRGVIKGHLARCS